MNRQGWLGSFFVVTVMISGCGRSPAPPPTVSQKPATSPATPTTQQLVNGPFKKLSLSPLPLSAQVPTSWDIKSPEGTQLTFLQGPAPDGQELQISLEVGTPQTPDQLKNILTHAQRDADKDKQTYRMFQIKDLGEVQAMEQQKVFTSGSQQLIDWKVTYFIHREIDYAPCVVDVLGLTSDRFEKDKDLLQKIFDSITYEKP